MEQFNIFLITFLPSIFLTPPFISTSASEAMVMISDDGTVFKRDVQSNPPELTTLQQPGEEPRTLESPQLWPNRTVPYQISDEYLSWQKDVITGTLKVLEGLTCVQFRPRQDEQDFIFIGDGTVCSSHIGRKGGGRQNVTLSRSGCVAHGEILHAISHALGLWHEHSRMDRDEYISIQWENLPRETRHNFLRYISPPLQSAPLPYSYGSNLHFREDDFLTTEAKAAGKKSILSMRSKFRLGQQRTHLTGLDVRKINLIYCPELVMRGGISKIPRIPKFLESNVRSKTLQTELPISTEPETTREIEMTTTDSLEIFSSSTQTGRVLEVKTTTDMAQLSPMIQQRTENESMRVGKKMGTTRPRTAASRISARDDSGMGIPWARVRQIWRRKVEWFQRIYPYLLTLFQSISQRTT